MATEMLKAAHSALAGSMVTELEEFSHQVASSFVPLRVTADTPNGFAARLSSTEADNIAFTEVSARPHLIERTPETIASGGSEFYKVSLLLSGSSILVQDGKELVMQAGDLSIYDTSRPYSLLFGEDFRNLIMMFPKDRLDLPIPFTEQLTAVSLREQHSGLAPLITTFLSQFPNQLAPLSERVRARLARTSLDLIGTMFSSILDTEPTKLDPRHALLQRIHDHIDLNLASPTLSPGSISAAHFISTRHLHALFRQSGTTVSTWIRERRLEHCRADLLDPALADRTILHIASRWGFTDAAHFSRVFKTAYGVAPSELRHQ